MDPSHLTHTLPSCQPACVARQRHLRVLPAVACDGCGLAKHVRRLAIPWHHHDLVPPVHATAALVARSPLTTMITTTTTTAPVTVSGATPRAVRTVPTAIMHSTVASRRAAAVMQPVTAPPVVVVTVSTVMAIRGIVVERRVAPLAAPGCVLAIVVPVAVVVLVADVAVVPLVHHTPALATVPGRVLRRLPPTTLAVIP